MPKAVNIPVNPANEELRQIKARQKARQKIGKPQKVSLDDVYQMLSDVLENQARQENMLRELIARK